MEGPGERLSDPSSTERSSNPCHPTLRMTQMELAREVARKLARKGLCRIEHKKKKTDPDDLTAKGPMRLRATDKLMDARDEEEDEDDENEDPLGGEAGGEAADAKGKGRRPSGAAASAAEGGATPKKARKK